MSDNTTEHVHACEFPEHTKDKQDFGCHCACGAILHWLGWQKPKTQEAAEPTLLPCAVHVEEEDTLPQWLFVRYGPGHKRWDEYDPIFWEHEAAAVRRAVDRGGFKEKQ